MDIIDVLKKEHLQIIEIINDLEANADHDYNINHPHLVAKLGDFHKLWTEHELKEDKIYGSVI